MFIKTGRYRGDYARVDGKNEKDLIRLIQNYFSTTEDLMDIMDASWQRRLQYQKNMMSHHFEVKDKLGREQWTKVFYTA